MAETLGFLHPAKGDFVPPVCTRRNPPLSRCSDEIKKVEFPRLDLSPLCAPSVGVVTMREQPRVPHYRCFMCGDDCQMGGGVWEADWIRLYEITACKTCQSANYDGWGPDCEEKLIPHLEKKGLPVPSRNGGGWLPVR